ncbi:Arc family DNA-binding protein [Martelella sp. FLE1502]
MIIASRGMDQIALRTPDGLRDRIKAAAIENGRSMNSEIVYQLGKIYPANAATEGQIGVGSSAAASSNSADLAGGASITTGIRGTNDE